MQEHVGAAAVHADENSEIRLLWSARTPSTKKLPSPTASRITRV